MGTTRAEMLLAHVGTQAKADDNSGSFVIHAQATCGDGQHIKPIAGEACQDGSESGLTYEYIYMYIYMHVCMYVYMYTYNSAVCRQSQ